MNTQLIANNKQLETWAGIVRECKTSGMKTKDWLVANNIKRDQYYYWYRQLREKAIMGELVKPAVQAKQIVKLECETQMITSSVSSEDAICIERNNVHICIPCNANTEVIRTIVEVTLHAE